MADGDSVKPSTPKRSTLLDRHNRDSYSYFFNHQVVRCITEQEKILASRLVEKEKEAGITYDKSLIDLFGPSAQINSAFLQLIFGSDEPVNIDGLIDELRTLATKDNQGCVTRLLDLLLVTNRKTLLLEEQEIRQISYDLYDKEFKGKFGSMSAFNNLVGNDRFSYLCMVLAMIASGQDEVRDSGLIFMATSLKCPWDALVLSRFFYGSNHEITRKIDNEWKSVVMKDSKFRVINITRSFDGTSLKEAARTLMHGASNKQELTGLFDAYRCLAIALAANSSQTDEFTRNLELAEASTLMRSVFVTLLSWGKFMPARSMVVDLAKRAPPGGVPSDICEIGLRCLVDLIEFLQKLQENGGDVSQHGSLKGIAIKWRREINQGSGEMKKLKTENAGTQKVVYDWMFQLCTVLRGPVHEEPKGEFNKKMECIFISAEFLKDMLIWAVTSKNENDPFHLVWPEGFEPFIINDDSIIIPDRITRSRTTSVGSTTKAAAPVKDDGKKQNNMGEAKQDRPTRPQDKFPNVPMAENKHYQKEKFADIRQDGQNARGTQRQGQHNPIGASGAPAQLMARAPEKNEWGRDQRSSQSMPQDVRRSMHQAGDASEQNGLSGMHSNAHHSNNYGQNHNASCTIVPSVSTNAPFRSDNWNNRSDQSRSPMSHESILPRSSPTSASSSNQDVTPSTPSIPKFLDEIMQRSPSHTHTLVSPPPSHTTQSANTGTTQEQTGANSEESVKINAAEAMTVHQSIIEQLASPASQQSPIPQQPTMGTAAANEARARRSQENVQSADQSSEKEDPQTVPPDTHYQELMQKEAEQGENDGRAIAPDPSEMNKLFTGNSKGQSTLPAFLATEQTGGDAARPATIMQPPPPPTLVTAAESASLSPSLGLIQLAPPEGVVLPPDSDVTPRTCVSSSAESMLTPITEASQETFGTVSTSRSMCDAAGLHHGEMADNVFDDPNLGELRVDTTVQPLHDQHFAVMSSASRGSLASQATPNEDDLLTPKDSPLNDLPQSQSTPCEYDLALSNSYNSSNQSRYASSNEMQRQDTPTVSPQMSTPATESTVTGQTTEVAEVRRESEDTSQQHQPIDTPSAHNVVASTPEVNQSEPNGHESTQVQPIGEQLSVDCSEPEVKELVTSCGVSYKFSPSHSQNDESSSSPVSSTENVQSMQQPPQETQGGFLDGFLSQIPSVPVAGGEVTQELVSAEQNASASHTMSNEVYGSDKSVTKEEIDEHAALRREYSSERGDASELGSMAHPFPETFSDVPTLPSTAMTTPDHNGQPPFDYNSGNSQNLGEPSVEKAEVTQMSSVSSTIGNEWGQQQQHSPTFEQMHPPLQSAHLAPQQQNFTNSNLDSFAQQQTTQFNHHAPVFVPQVENNVQQSNSQYNQYCQQMHNSGDFASQRSVSGESFAQQHQPTTQSNHDQTQQFGNSACQNSMPNDSYSQLQQPGNAVSQPLSIPKYEDPFAVQPSIPPSNQQQMLHSSTGFSQNATANAVGEEFVPCFGTGGGNRGQNEQESQSGGHGGSNENQNKGFGSHFQGQGGHDQGHGFNQGRGGHNQYRTYVSHNQGRGGQSQGQGGQNQAFGGPNQGHGDQTQGFGDQNQAFGDQKQGFGDQSQTQGFTQGFTGGQNQGQGEQSHGFTQGGYGGQNYRGRGGGRGDRGERRGSRGRGGGGRGGMGGMQGGGGGGQGSGFAGFAGVNQQQQQSGHGSGDGFGGGDYGHQKENQMNQNQGQSFSSSQSTRGSSQPVRGGRGFH